MLENPTDSTSFNTIVKNRESKEQKDDNVILIFDFVKGKWKNKHAKEKKRRHQHRVLLCAIVMIIHICSSASSLVCYELPLKWQSIPQCGKLYELLNEWFTE
jgi:hypothetical protein